MLNKLNSKTLKSILGFASIIGLVLLADASLAATNFEGAIAREAMTKASNEIKHIASLISYGIGAAGGLAAAFFILAKQNMGAGAIAVAASVAGVALPTMFASGALI